MGISDEDTLEFKRQKSFAESFFAPDEPRLELQIAAATDVGKVRHRNEDHYAVVRNTRSREVLFTNLPADDLSFPADETYSMVVADGIGGASSGDQASRLALQTMLDLAGRATSWVMKVTDLESQEIRQRVEAYVSEMQKTLRLCVEANPERSGMGTTWTSAHVLGRQVIAVHIGDSRAYLYRNAQLLRITRDQTLGQEMADSGMPESDARQFRNILTNSLGGTQEEVPSEIYQFELHVGDRLLLCTDGLTDMVSESAVAELLAKRMEPHEACSILIEKALVGGGTDNITVILCDACESSQNPSSGP